MSRPRQRGILRESERLQVYIYSVGPFGRKIELGSPGVVILPSLDEAKVLNPKFPLAVAGPLVREGFPAEPFVSEPRGRWIEHEPDPSLQWRDEDGEVFVLAERPGIDEALRIIGAHEQSPRPLYNASPYEQGCFVSVIPEQTKPEEPKEPGAKADRTERRLYEKAMLDHEENIRLWFKWEASVLAAQKRFLAWAARRGEEQCLAFANGTYVRDEELFVLARILNKTDRDWNFLSGTVANVANKQCHWCGKPMLADRAKCPTCMEWQPGMKPKEVASA